MIRIFFPVLKNSREVIEEVSEFKELQVDNVFGELYGRTYC